MIITKLKGGLGNQMFQYAFGRAVSHHLSTKLKLDISDLKENKLRDYSLSFFNIQEDIASHNDIKKFIPQKKITKKLLQYLNNFKPYQKRNYINETQIKIPIYYGDISNSTYIDGYWQNEKYFSNIQDILKKEFTLKKENDINQHIKKSISESISISLHIRKGDYTSSKHSKIYENLPSEYYEKAIKHIKQKISKDTRIFIFSDDINWVKNNLSLDNNAIFVSQPNKTTDHEELTLMSLCKHNIIANSTFSWWGAWLNSNSNKIVVAPKNWFKNKEINKKEITPKAWLKI